MQLKAVLTAKSHGTTTMKTKITTRVTLTGRRDEKVSVAEENLAVKVVVVPRALERAKRDKKARPQKEMEMQTQFNLSGHSHKNRLSGMDAKI